MADISFSQPERRSYAIPALIAFAILAIAAGIFFWRVPMRAVDLSVPRVATLPTHTVFAVATRVVGERELAEDAFYVLATVHVRNNLRVPISIKDITGTLTSAEDEAITASAVQKNDLPNLYITFPKLKPLSSPPLYRESEIQPGTDAEGMVILSFPVAEDTWNRRKSATVTVALYHQGEFTTEIPKTAPTSK